MDAILVGFPPLQAVVRAMDTISTFAATKNAQAKINKFVVAGASKVSTGRRTRVCKHIALHLLVHDLVQQPGTKHA